MIIMLRWFLIVNRVFYTLFVYVIKMVMYYFGKLLVKAIILTFNPEKNVNKIVYIKLINLLFQLFTALTTVVGIAAICANCLAWDLMDITIFQKLVMPRQPDSPDMGQTFSSIIKLWISLVELFLTEINYSVKTNLITPYLILYWAAFLGFVWYIITRIPNPLYKNLLQLSYIVLFLLNAYFFFQYYLQLTIIFDTCDAAIINFKKIFLTPIKYEYAEVSFEILWKPQINLLISTLFFTVVWASIYIYLDILTKKSYSIVLNS